MNEFRAGFAEIDITPKPGGRRRLPYIPEASIEGVQWPLHGRVAVFDDGGTRAAIVALDLGSVLPETSASLCAAMAERGGLPAGNILISCSHTHNGPRTAFSFGEPPELNYLQRLEAKLADAVAAAVAGLEPVKLRHGRTRTTGLSFNRRPVYAGGEVGTHGPRWVEDFVAPEGPTDEELQVLFALRPDGSIAGGVVNWACHPHMLLQEPVYSADFVGAMTEKLAERHGGTFLFLQGAAGNLSWDDPSSKPDQGDEGATVDDEAATRRRIAMATDWADALVEAAEAARTASEPVAGEGIRAAKRTVDIAQRTPTREQVELAFWFLAQEPGSVDLDEFNQKMTGHRYTIYGNSPLQDLFAREAIGMWEWHHRAGLRPPLQPVELIALAIGDVAFAGYPAEMFTEFGLRTKAESPFAATFVCELANGWVGYIPTAEAFDHGGYETRIAFSSRLVPTAGDTMTATVVNLLNDLAARAG
jgi:neutral ceramidase